MKKFGYLVTLTLFWVSGTVFAVPLDIDPFVCTFGTGTNGIARTDVTGNSGGASECYGTFDGNDPGPGAAGLETEGTIFDYVAKVEVLPNGTLVGGLGDVDIGLSITGDNGLPDASGTWSYDSTKFMADAFIIVIKAANMPGWAAWLFEGEHAFSDTGNWLIAWVANNGLCTPSADKAVDDNCADISHLSIYAKNGTMVPEPATVALLGLGLIGFGLARRRKIK